MGRERQAPDGETLGPSLCWGPFLISISLKAGCLSSFYKPGQKLREVKCPAKATQHGPCLELELGLRPKSTCSFHPDNKP